MNEIITSVQTPNGEFLIRPSRSEDRSGLLALWKAAFGREADMDIWQWKYGGPYGHCTMVCVHEDGRIAAAYPGVPLPAQIHGKAMRLDLLMDSMSDPDFRGVLGGRRGLFVRTAQAYFAQFGGADKSWAVYGFPGERHFKLGQYLLTYAALPKQPAFLTRQTAGGGWTWRTTQVVPWDSSMGLDLFTVLEARLRPQYPMAVVRDGTFLDWRFLKHPSKEYRIWLAKTLGGRLLGYAVTSVCNDRVRLVDMLLPREDGVVGPFLLRLRKELQSSAEVMETWLPQEHFLIPMFAAAGFGAEREPIGFITTRKDLTPEVTGLLDQYFYYTLGDTDVD